jgi:hypothetical protein
VLARHESPTIARNLARAERRLRGQLELVFMAELGGMPGDVRADVLDVLDVLTSWEAWERARTLQRLSPAAARRALAHAVSALLAAPPTRPHGPGSGPGERGASR